MSIIWHLLARELRALPRQRAFLAARLLVVVIGVAVLGLTLWDHQRSQGWVKAGGVIFNGLSLFILCVGPPLAMLTGALTLYRELSGRTLGLLALTGAPLPILLGGKTLAALAHLCLALLTLAPVLCFALSFGGVNAQTMVTVLGYLAANLWVSLALGLLAGALARREAGVFGWLLVFGLLQLLAPTLLTEGLRELDLRDLARQLRAWLDPWYGLSRLLKQAPLAGGLELRVALALFNSSLALWLCARVLRWRLRDDWPWGAAVQSWGRRAGHLAATLRRARQAAHRWCQAHATLLNARLPIHWLPAAWRVSRRRPDFSGPHPIMAMEVWRWHRLLGRWLWLYLPLISLLVISMCLWYFMDAGGGTLRYLWAISESWLLPIFLITAILIPVAWVFLNTMAVSRDHQAGLWAILHLTPLDTRAILAEKSAAYRRLLWPFGVWLLLCLPTILLSVFRLYHRYAAYSWINHAHEYLTIGLLILVWALAMGHWGRWCALRFATWAQ